MLSTCVALKIALILIDDRVRLFMGDSATYLWSALSLHIPTDRSYTYPLFIRAIAMPFASIAPLLWAQTLCGVATAAMIAWLLRSVFSARRRVAFCAAMLVSLDPLQLFYERMVMTESLSTCVLIASLCVAVAYVRSGRVGLLVACVMLGVASASLRVGMVPLAYGLCITAVVLRWDAARRKEIMRHLAIALALTCAAHGGYRHLYGFAMHTGPNYIRDGGLFRLGLVAPLVNAEDFDGTRVDPHLLEEVTIPLADETTREAQIWAPDGLIDVLKRRAGPRAYKVASKIAAHAMWRDPLGVSASASRRRPTTSIRDCARCVCTAIWVSDNRRTRKRWRRCAIISATTQPASRARHRRSIAISRRHRGGRPPACLRWRRSRSSRHSDSREATARRCCSRWSVADWSSGRCCARISSRSATCIRSRCWCC